MDYSSENNDQQNIRTIAYLNLSESSCFQYIMFINVQNKQLY